jgi:hypothetical protein
VGERPNVLLILNDDMGFSDLISGTISRHRYIPRGLNHLHTIFEGHFAGFCGVYRTLGQILREHIRWKKQRTGTAQETGNNPD